MSATRTPSGSLIHISIRPHSSSRGLRTTGASHSPLLAIDAGMWAGRAKDDLRKTDGRVVAYAELLEETGGRPYRSTVRG
ncbi:MAG TPA: hypothetical protein VGL39_18275 [Jatrophihabitantaceae bacterium]